MARKHGQRGRLYAGIASATDAAEPIAYIKKWSMDNSTAKVDATAFEDENIVMFPGKENASGAFEGFWDTATEQLFTAAQDGTQRRFYLYPDINDAISGPYFFGEAFFDQSMETPIDGMVAITGNWTAATAITKGP